MRGRSREVTLSFRSHWPSIPIHFVVGDVKNFLTLAPDGNLPVAPEQKYDSLADWKARKPNMGPPAHAVFVPAESNSFYQGILVADLRFNCKLDDTVVAKLTIHRVEEAPQSLNSNNVGIDPAIKAAAKAEANAVCGFVSEFLYGHMELTIALGLADAIYSE